jgi:DNA-binding transcriptional LysR family regulator
MVNCLLLVSAKGVAKNASLLKKLGEERFMRHLLPYKYVEEIAKAGSIRKAAETLAITPSALNRRLLTIEDELGVQIFERLPVGVRLNTAGEILLEHIRNQMSDMERVKSQIADLSGQRRGTVSIVTSPELQGSFLAGEVLKYQSEFPGVTFQITQKFRGEVEQALIEHQADIGIVYEPTKLADFQTLYNLVQPVYCIMEKSHPLAAKKSLRLYECAEFPLILTDKTWGVRNLLSQSAIRLGINLRAVIQSDSRGFLNNYGRTSEQLSFDIPINIPENLDERGMLAVPINPLDVPEGFVFVGHLKGRTIPVASARFLEQVTTQMAGQFG